MIDYRDLVHASQTAIDQDWLMEPMHLTVLSARVVAGKVRAVVQADRQPNARIRLLLSFPIFGPTDIWAAARDEALKYLDIA